MTTDHGVSERTEATRRSRLPRPARCRDLVYWPDGGSIYVLASDSNAGIGALPGDTLAKDPAEVGYSAAKVPLMEVIAAGADPFLLTNSLGGPLDDYGGEILAGIRAALAEVDADITVTGSDETNIPTRQTAVGVSVLGRASVPDIRWGSTRDGDLVVAVGYPRDGLYRPYAEGDADVASVADLRRVARLAGVHELLPVGSKGVGYEARQLADGVGGTLVLLGGHPLDLAASAGASTCFLVTLPTSAMPELRAATRLAVTEIGRSEVS